MTTHKHPDDVVLKILREARGYLAKGWVQGMAACDAGGKPVRPVDERACRWCLSGALERAVARCGAVNADLAACERALMNANPALRGLSPLQEFNDEHGRKLPEVIAVIDAAGKARAAMLVRGAQQA